MKIITTKINAWEEINKKIPENIKCQCLIESVNTNKEIRGLPWYVGAHVLTILEKKEEQTMNRVF